MNWNDLRYFVSLVNEQTLSAVAEQLDVQHTTVARRIACLEQAIGLRLFERIGRRYTLTREGKRLYVQACEIQQGFDAFNRMTVEQNTMQGIISVSAPPVLANERLIPHVPAFHARFPDICLDIQGEVRRSNLYQREADIALRLRRPVEESLVIKKLTEIRYQFHAHVDYWRNSGRALIDFYVSEPLSTCFHHVQQQTGYKVAFKTNDLYMAKHAIEQGLGIGILPVDIVKDDSTLIPVNLLDNDSDSLDVYTAEMYLVMHEDVRHSKRVRAVADWLGGLFAE